MHFRHPQKSYDQIIQDGLRHHDQGDRERALALLGSAIALNPHRSDGFTHRGAIWIETGNFPQAERDLRAALALGPCAIASYHLALLLSEQQRNPEAIEILELALDASPDDSDLWHMFGIILDRVNEPARAVEAYDHAIEAGHIPDGELFAARGVLHVELQQWLLAADDFETAILYGNRCSEVFYWQGLTAIQLQRWAYAVTSFTRAIPGDPNNPAIYQARSIAYAALGKKECALQDQRRADRLSQ